MSEKEEQVPSIEISLIDSITKAELRGLAADATEMTLDSVLADELLQAIPIVGTVGRIYRASLAIRDRLFLRKVLSFLNEFSDVSESDRRRFGEQLDENAGSRSRAGAALALLLERLDDLDKPQIIGRLYRAKLEGRLSFEELWRFCMIVDRAHLPDLLALTGLPAGHRVEQNAAPYLHALGLVSITAEDLGTVVGTGADTRYEVNDLGNKLLAIALH